MIYCTCGHLWVQSKSSPNFHQWRLNAISIPHYVIKKGRPHGARHGETEAQKKHFVAHKARKRCINKNFDGIHDRFQRDPVFHDSQLKIGWTEKKCIAMDKLAQGARGWIRRNTKIGPVMNIHVCRQEDRYSIEIQVRSLFQDGTASRVRL